MQRDDAIQVMKIYLRWVHRDINRRDVVAARYTAKQLARFGFYFLNRRDCRDGIINTQPMEK